MPQITVEEAYQEACLALGEAMVRERIMTRIMAQTEQQGGQAPATTS